MWCGRCGEGYMYMDACRIREKNSTGITVNTYEA